MELSTYLEGLVSFSDSTMTSTSTTVAPGDVNRSTTSQKPTTSTTPFRTTTTTDPDNPMAGSLMTAAAVAMCLGIVVLSCATVLSIKFFHKSQRRSGLRITCFKMLTCECVRELCCAVEDDENQTAAAPEDDPDSMDPPRYDLALGMQRLDSTTIPGTPPPLYKSLKQKASADVEGNLNMGFEFPHEFSRRLSRDEISVMSVFSVFEFTSCLSSQSYPDELVVPQISPLAHPTLDVQTNSREWELGPDTGDVTVYVGTEAEIDIGTNQNPTVCGTSPLFDSTHSSGLLSERADMGQRDEMEREVVSGGDAVSETLSITDNLPSYADVLSWIDGTNL